MEIKKARVDAQNRLCVLVDAVPRWHDIRYKAVPVRGEDVLYFGEKDGYVNFLLSTWDKTGFSGRTFEVILKDGNSRKLIGPWSSRAALVHKLGLPHCVPVNITDDENGFGKDYLCSGHITLAKAKEAAALIGKELYQDIDNFGDLVYSIK